MENQTYLDTVLSYMDVELQRCHDAEHSETWYEKSSKACYDLWVIQEGRIQIQTEQQTTILGQNDAFLLYPDLLYKAVCVTERCRFVYLHFHCRIGHSLRGLDGFALYGGAAKEDLGNTVPAFLQAFTRYEQKEPLSGLLLKGSFLSLLSAVLRSNLNRAKQEESTRKKTPIGRLQPVCEYISDHLYTPIRISELAALTGVSEKYFITLFQKTFGMTPGAYITEARMKKAADYLSTHQYSVKEIAALLGYPDPYTFSKAFKRNFQCSPTKYEKMTNS